MRRCLIGDLIEAAATIAATPWSDPHDHARRLVAQADAAHKYDKRIGRPHPRWGNGSLMARALADAGHRPRPAPSTEAFLSAMSVLCAVLAEHKQAIRAKNGTDVMALSRRRQIC